MIITYDRQNIFMVQTTVGRNSSLDKTSFIAIGLGLAAEPTEKECLQGSAAIGYFGRKLPNFKLSCF